MTDVQAGIRAELIDRLRSLVARHGEGTLFPCIEDLVCNGPNLPGWKTDGAVLNRQDATQYLAAWGRFAGFDEDTCRTWLMDYAIQILSAISSSSASAIRHSTKSNVRYIYRSLIPFVCEREQNRVRARCDTQCPVYETMAGKTLASELARTMPRPEPAPPMIHIPVKERYRKQFEAALEFARDALAKGESQETILTRLNEQGMKTRTGRPWTYSILNREIRKLRHQA